MAEAQLDGKYLVGLTGGIGSGKSAAADRFAEHGITIVDADIASRAVVEPQQPALAKISEQFGNHLVTEAGELDRTALRHLVFADPKKRKWLQGLLHPLITKYLIENIREASSPYVMLVNPLLFETRQDAWCAKVLVIDVPEKLQLTRTMARDDNTREQVENIMRAQLDRSSRLARATDVIVNDQDLATLHERVDQIHNKYLQQCQTLPE